MNEPIEENRALIEINAAQRALERANDIHEITILRDQAAAFVLFANAQGFKEAAQEAKIFQLRAERKAGDWLEKNVNHNGNKFGAGYQDGIPLPDSISLNESHRWQLQAALPERQFNEWIDDCLSTNKEITAAGLRRESLKARRQDELAQIEGELIVRPDGLFDVISVDPPWPYGTGYDPDGRRVASPYPEMSIDEIAAIDIPAVENCILWLWTTHKFMRDAFELLDYWGFRDVAIVTWVKDRMGLGHWLRSQSEFVIMAVKGSPKVQLTNQTTILYGRTREHSRKPEEFYKMVDTLCIGRKLDYFSRESRSGWEQVGNETNRFERELVFAP